MIRATPRIVPVLLACGLATALATALATVLAAESPQITAEEALDALINGVDHGIAARLDDAPELAAIVAALPDQMTDVALKSLDEVSWLGVPNLPRAERLRLERLIGLLGLIATPAADMALAQAYGIVMENHVPAPSVTPESLERMGYLILNAIPASKAPALRSQILSRWPGMTAREQIIAASWLARTAQGDRALIQALAGMPAKDEEAKLLLEQLLRALEGG